jgi:hypothetical protein
MSVKFSRSTSFFSVDATQSLDKLLRETRRYKTKFVVVNVDRGLDDPSFYLAEHKHFVDAIMRLKERVKELKDASQIAGDITLQDLLDAQKDAPEKVETTFDPVTRLSERTRSAIKGGNVVVHFRKDKPTSILLPSTIAFNKLSSRGWLNLNQLTGFQYIDVSDPGEPGGGPFVGGEEGAEGEEKESGQAGAAEPDETTGEEEKKEASLEEVRAEPSPGGAATSASAEPSSKTPGQAPETAKGNGGGTQPPQGGSGGGNGGGNGGTGGAAPDDWPAYPEIELSEEHPVQSKTIDVEVYIKFVKPAKTVGTIKLPHDNKKYVLDVHLLLGKESRWSKLVFQRPKGTVEAAIFEDVTVPSIPQSGKTKDERLLRDIYVNFYLLDPYDPNDATPVRSARWCGEAVRTIEILARKGMEPTPIEPPAAVEWREHLHLPLTSPPPDLLVRIQRLSEREFQWTVLSPHRDFKALPPSDLYSRLSTAPFTFMQDNFEKLAGKPLDEDQVQKVNEACDLIYAAAPPGFQQAYWDLRLGTGQDPKKRAPLETIQFVSDEPYIPWELMRVADDDRASNEKPEILALRHAVGRWIAPDSHELRQSLSISEIAVFATDYAKVAAIKNKLKWAPIELQNLVDNFSAVEKKVLKAVMTEFLKGGQAQAIHFSCHGEMNVQIPDKALIKLEDADLFASTVWSTETRRGIGRQRPLVFLNACQTGATGELLGFVFGWPQAFLRMGATACVAPLWSVIDESAKDAAADFYELVLKGNKESGGQPLALGEALRAVRSKWKDKKSLTYLGYILYGDPTAMLTWHDKKQVHP